MQNRVILGCFLLAALWTAILSASPGGVEGNRAGSCLSICLDRLGLTADQILPAFLSPDSSLVKSPNLKNAARLNLGQGVRVFTKAVEGLDSCSTAMEFLVWMRREAGIAGLVESTRLEPPQSIRAAMDSLDRLFPGRKTGYSIDLLWRAACQVDSALDSLSAGERKELEDLVRRFPLEADQWPHYPVERFVNLSSRIDLGDMARALVLVDSACTFWRALPANAWQGREPFILTTDLGEVVLLGPGDDRYQGAPLLLVDFGGSDSLLLEQSRPGAVSLLLDLDGNDCWSAADSFGGAALMGAVWLEDRGGDDLWLGGVCGPGFAACGASVLLDRNGNDHYSAACAGQGAALSGLSLMLDEAGDDSCTAGIIAQGALLGRGTALLADLRGNDFRRAGGRTPDWRDPEATRSWAQGASLGLRPFAAGGLACLYDRSGNDTCQADCFAQGAGYWGGVGLLIDRAGNDSYTAGRYAQGVGLHFAAGCLIDAAGDDSYRLLRGVGQGAGEDRALGLLVEYEGDDAYSAGWMSRGAGGTGGVGLLLEMAGNDLYETGLKLDSGAGYRWQELAGLGFLFDCAGRDPSAGQSVDNTISRTGTWGARVDLEEADAESQE